MTKNLTSTKIAKKLLVFVTVLSVGVLTGCASNGGFQATVDQFKQAGGSALSGLKEAGGSFMSGYETGVLVAPETLAQITEGSSMADVEALIGPAPEIDAGANGEIWTYQYTKIPHFGENINQKTIVRFDANGKVTRAYQTSGGATNTGNPLLDAASKKGYL